MRRVWTTQPPAGTPIDWDSPFAQGLHALYAPGSLNAVTGRLTANSGAVLGASAMGLAYSGFTTSAFLTDAAVPYVPPPFSALAFVTSTAAIGGSAAQAILSFGGAAAGYGWKFGGGNATYNITSDQLCLTYGDVADYGFSGSYFSQLGVPVVVGLSVGSSTATAYRNGSEWGTVSVGTPTVPTQPARIGADYNGSAGTIDDPWTDQIAFVGLWGLELAASAQALLARNPWQLYWKRRRAYSIPTSSGAAGTAAITEASDTVSATGNIAIPGTASITEASDTVAATGALAIAGTAAITEGSDTVSATGVGGEVGTAAITESSDTVSATGALSVAGTAAITEQPDVVAATGGIALSGAAAIFEAGDIVVATGALGLAGTAAITEAPDSVAGTGSGPQPVNPMPNFIGFPINYVIQILAAQGLAASLTYQLADPPGTTMGLITAQSPAPGQQLKAPVTFTCTGAIALPAVGVRIGNFPALLVGNNDNPGGRSTNS